MTASATAPHALSASDFVVAVGIVATEEIAVAAATSEILETVFVVPPFAAAAIAFVVFAVPAIVETARTLLHSSQFL